MTNARLLERISLFLIKDIYNFPDLDYKRDTPFKGIDEHFCIIPQHTPHFISIARQKRRS